MNALLFDKLVEATGEVAAQYHWETQALEAKKVLSITCGHCEHWMKTPDCPREAEGHKCSMNERGCSKFQRMEYVVEIYNERMAQIPEKFRPKDPNQ